MSTTKEMLEKVLDDLKEAVEVEASAIISREGLLMASDLSWHLTYLTISREGLLMASDISGLFAAMSATMLGAAETATAELWKGISSQIIVELKKGKVIAYGAGPKAILVTITPPKAELSPILVEMEKAADKIKGLL
ncbi:MAG: roadblock/LC7 domain-containing protein [Methanocellales archaeon]|nr:roadblock/LC7 domain-containing protein [Methanocellales archaeon]